MLILYLHLLLFYCLNFNYSTYKDHSPVELMTSPVLTDLSSGFEIDGSGVLGGTLGDS